MGFAIPSGYVYEPADLGLNAVTVGATLTVNGLVVPWLARHDIKAVSWRVRWTNTGATPFDLFVAGAEIDAGSLSSNSTIHANFTNNPIPALANVSRWGNLGSVNSGALMTSAFSTIFNFPYLRFAVRNNHATIAVADMSVTVTVNR